MDKFFTFFALQGPVDRFFAFFSGPVGFPVLCLVSAFGIGAGYVIGSAAVFVGGMGLMVLAVMTYVWEDSKRFPEIE
ncbi:MAG: hypothetical protein KBC02_04085 [Candidatus Pacebacteria bacterium]|nr:hypothetical protein [Candidatus Paceibacterota bacterium]